MTVDNLQMSPSVSRQCPGSCNCLRELCNWHRRLDGVDISSFPYAVAGSRLCLRPHIFPPAGLEDTWIVPFACKGSPQLSAGHRRPGKGSPRTAPNMLGLHQCNRGLLGAFQHSGIPPRTHGKHQRRQVAISARQQATDQV